MMITDKLRICSRMQAQTTLCATLVTIQISPSPC